MSAFSGTERILKPSYLTTGFDPGFRLLDGVSAKLECRRDCRRRSACAGAASPILRRRLFSRIRASVDSTITRALYIERARNAGGSRRRADRCSFDIATSKTFPGSDYDSSRCFILPSLTWAIPSSAAAHIRRALRRGTWLIWNLIANDDLENNLNPMGNGYFTAHRPWCATAGLPRAVFRLRSVPGW